ncbi:MAG: hypothetical protein B7Z68_03790 [Acidobacteria bacterium 21-70-11]|nr:MAG: hypothetical protein B7Z68_03790 [Acidobacteria bacterium 21-70-11]OYW05536.1 MAG: hypothetical protein B7Z61_05845 [Acidobacteria bacterium 37-71-11]
MVYDEFMAAPEYLICMECETPTYVFEWAAGKVVEAMCPVCGNDDPASFLSEDDFEAMTVGKDDEEGEEE